MDSVFEIYLGYKSAENRKKIVKFLREKRRWFLYVNNESPYDFFVS